ncbi:MAG: choice-of-anchor L domain-containing protein [Flavobacteriia bacterium]|nr:choice-of-anchor L domain-containing protein [Flavobacteriia bacterium]
MTPQQVIENLLVGEGVTVSNFSFNNVPANAQIIQPNVTSYTSTGFPFPSGFFMGTSMGSNIGNDPDLMDLANNPVTNGAILEFDFVPAGDTVKFRYIFGSTEYPGYTCSQFNDAFGFFISGPGINGPFSNNAVNLATVPGSTIPVSINTVNSGIPSGGDNSLCLAADPNFINNTIYFTNTYDILDGFGFSGATVAMTAISGVQCGQTYHIKLAIANAVDQSLDSGVFLEAGSLISTGLDVSLKTATAQGDSLIFEGCLPAEFIFTRPLSQAIDTMVIHYVFTGTAIPGVDYVASATGDSVVMFIDQDSVSLFIETDNIIDGLEGDETLIITVTFVSECGDTIIKSKTLTITEEPILNALSNDPILDCPDDSVMLTVAAVGGTPGYNYTWTLNGADVGQGDTIFVPILQAGQLTYNVHILDTCNFEFDHPVIVTLNQKPPLDLSVSAPNANCLTPTIPITATGSGGLAPLVFEWNTGETGTSINAPALGNPPPSYTVTMTDACNDSIQATHTVVFDPSPPLIIQVNDTTVKCPNDSVPINATVLNGNEPFTYTWSNGQTGQNTTVPIENNGTLSFTVDVEDICGSEGSATVNVTLDQTLNILSFNSAPTYTCEPTGELSAQMFGETGTVNYFWTGPGANNTDTITNTVYSNLTTGWYYLYVEDAVCFDADSVFVDIIPNPNAAFSYYEPSIDPPKDITFYNESTNATHYFWDFGNSDTLSIYNLNNVGSNYSDVGTYEIMLIAYSGPCSDTAYQSITIIPNPKYNLPNFFSPDNDSKNDLFSLNPLFFKEFTYQIFNRWGNLMYEGDLSSPTWDGKNTGGKDAQDGTYFYTYKGNALNGEVVEGHGYVQLTRK